MFAIPAWVPNWPNTSLVIRIDEFEMENQNIMLEEVETILNDLEQEDNLDLVENLVFEENTEQSDVNGSENKKSSEDSLILQLSETFEEKTEMISNQVQIDDDDDLFETTGMNMNKTQTDVPTKSLIPRNQVFYSENISDVDSTRNHLPDWWIFIWKW